MAHSKQKALKRLNTLSLVLGLLGSLGVSIVGNFQETSVVVVHFIGASLCFGLGTIYLWIQVQYVLSSFMMVQLGKVYWQNQAI